MTAPGPQHRSFRLGGFLAVIAAVGGATLLVLAVLGIVERIGSGDDESAAPTTTFEFPAGTDAPAGTTSTSAEPLITTTTVPKADPAGFDRISDDSGTLSIEVPRDWTDRSGRPWSIAGDDVGPALSAAPDLDAWYATWGTPGVFVGLAIDAHQPELGDFSEPCTRGNQAPYGGGPLAGTIQAWSGCGAEGGDFHEFVGGPDDGSYLVQIQLVSIDGDGLSQLDAILTSFTYTPATGGGG
jgi:serine protease Do